jgi:hypothetical protein
LHDVQGLGFPRFGHGLGYFIPRHRDAPSRMPFRTTKTIQNGLEIFMAISPAQTS